MDGANVITTKKNLNASGNLNSSIKHASIDQSSKQQMMSSGKESANR